MKSQSSMSSIKSIPQQFYVTSKRSVCYVAILNEFD